MAVRNALPFEFPFRWNDVRRFFGKIEDEAVDYLDQRDRDLEDFLAGLDDCCADPASYLLDYGSPGWSYSIGAIGHSTGFEDPAYDVSAWSVGSMAFGNADDAGISSTRSTDWPSTHSEDLCARRELPAGLTGVNVYIYVDDSVAAYVNDTLIYDNLGASGGAGGPETEIGPIAVDDAILNAAAPNVFAFRARDSQASKAWLDIKVVASDSPASAPTTTGSATIADGASTATVSHTLGVIPATVLLTPRANEAVWVSARDSSTFVASRAGSTGDLSVDWLATGEEAYVPPPPFTPTDLATLSAWFDASDEASFTFSTDASYPANVAQWNDLGPNGYHVTKATESQRPVRDVTLNGLSAVRFDGARWLNRSNSPINNSTDGSWTVFAVAYLQSVTGVRSIVDMDEQSGTRIGQFIRTNGTATDTIGFVGASAISDTGPSVAINTPYIFRSTNGAGAIEMAVNGASNGATAYAGTQNYAATNSPLSLGAFDSGAGQLFVGYIAEVVCCSSVLSSSDISTVETYLGDKWGV